MDCIADYFNEASKLTFQLGDDFISPTDTFYFLL